ncbi:MAG: hypothetical protein ACRDNW_01800 [Trebonia sp.]
MLKQIEGSRAVAGVLAMCRPQVIRAYPITPQTHIVEALGALVKKGELNAGFLNVESEFAAMSAVWNDHCDAMSQRDAGWIQLYAETSQEAADLHVQAFRIAEELSNPVMVCMDGFLLTHASERVDVPAQEEVDAFLRPCEPRQVLDPGDPVSIGAMVGPEAFTEVRYLADERMRRAPSLIPDVAADFASQLGRDSGGLVRPYRTDDAALILAALGSVLGTIKDTVDELRDDGIRDGVLDPGSSRANHTGTWRTITHADGGSLMIEKMRLDDTGFPQPTGEFEELSADCLVLALGQDLMTGHPGIFAGGDMVPDERTVTVAIGHGEKAARAIGAWLRGSRATAYLRHGLAGYDSLNTWYYADAPAAVRNTMASS